ncbi:MAG: hypothetical protein ACPG6V_02385 [Flavobacteriales bacterium]
MDLVNLQQDIKSTIDTFSFLSRDVLHVYGGVMLYLLWQYLFQNKKSKLFFFLLFILAFVNEVFDTLGHSNHIQGVNWEESLSDVFNTVSLPLVLHIFYNKIYKRKR